jgi:hypothetical protein
MNRRLLACAALLTAGTLFGAARPTSDPAELVVHEWGTFTSIAGGDGLAVQWTPQAGPTDLPCFVHRNPYNPKAGLWGTVRMETPVLYFYTPRELTVRVGVGFHQGLITEWFPDAAVTPAPNYNVPTKWEGTIRWNDVTVKPNAAADFRTEPGASHYYVARRTDAAPVIAASETERFLFYRGVGRFAPPLIATTADDGSVTIASASGAPLGDVILFENRGGAMAYETRHVDGRQVTLTLPAVQDEIPTPTADLEGALVKSGLYPREARAMVETWRDSWFEEGVRIFYVVPAVTIDKILPLEIEPLPSNVVRVFVGRMEVVTPATQQIVRDALGAGDRATLQKYGRFLQPIISRLTATATPMERAMIDHQLQQTSATAWASPSRCE